MKYSKKYYEGLGRNALDSAREVVPLILDMVRPTSVADVGCGVGTWSSIFLELGIKDLQGFDADWVPKNMLQIPSECFYVADLTKRLKVNRTFDLAI